MEKPIPEHPFKVNLGCGKDVEPGWVNIDLDPTLSEWVVYKRNIEKGLPFWDETVKEIRAWHILEHINDLNYFMSEIYRILEKGGIVDIRVPHPDAKNRCAFTDPTHVRFFTEETFTKFMVKKNLNENEPVRYFDIKNMELWDDGQLCVRMVKL